MLANTRRFGPYSVYLTLAFVYGLATATIFTVNLLYEFEIAKLSPLQLVLVGTVLETSYFLCQVPTGALADLYSRRLSVILGVVIIGLGFVLEGLVPNFWVIAGSMVFYGVGATFMRGSQAGGIGSTLGALLSVALASIRLNLPVVIGGVLLVLLGLLLILVMPENCFQPASSEGRHSWHKLGNTIQAGFRTAWISPTLLLILGVGLCFGLASEGVDRLSQPHLQSDFNIPALGSFAPIVWFGLIAVLGNLLVVGVSELVRRCLKLDDQRVLIRVLMALNVLGILSLLAFAFASNFYLAVFAFWCVSISREVKEPLYTTWLTRNSPARERATLISFAGQMDALGQIAGGPPIGYLGTVTSLRVALASASIILAPVLLLYAAALRRMRGKAPAPIADEDAEAANHWAKGS